MPVQGLPAGHHHMGTGEQVLLAASLVQVLFLPFSLLTSHKISHSNTKLENRIVYELARSCKPENT